MEPKKTPWGKIAAVVIALVVVVGVVAAYILLQAPPPAPENNAPVIQTVTADKGAADINEQVSFTASATDEDEDTLTYTWDLGDNGTATGGTVNHQYAYSGNYIAVVTVSDGEDEVNSEARPVFILVNQAQRAEPGSPTDEPNPVALISADRSIVEVNDTIEFIGNSSWTWAYDAAAGAWAFNDASTNASAITLLSYDFGDGTADVTGTPLQVGKVTHQFTTAGSHFVRLAVTNYLGNTDTVGYTVRVTAAAAPTGIVKNPDIFTEVLFGEPDSLDPAYDYETSGGQVIQNVVETLIWYDREHADVFKPQLATKVPDVANPADVSPDGLTFNLTLRSGVTFHSGNPVNCAAVEFSFERVMLLNDPAGPAWILDQSLTGYAEDDPGTPGVDERLVAIQNSVTCPDGPTGLAVQLNLAIPYPAFVPTLAFTAAAIIDPDPSSYRVTGRCPSTDLMANYCHDQLIGTGPFKLRVWQPNQQIILDGNTAYWNAAVKAVPFKEVHILKANDVATRVLMLKAGDADSIALPFNHKDDIRDTGGNLLPGIAEYSGETFVVQFLGYNQNINVTGAGSDIDVPATFFADVHVRKAFSYAWRYTDFIQNVVFGYGSTLCSAVPRGMLGYDATVPCYSHDLVKAQAEFQLALDPRTPDPTDTYWDNGFHLTSYFNIGNTVREEGSRLFETVLEGMNSAFTIDVRGLEWASFLSTVNNKIPALFFLGWAPDYADPDDYVVPFLRSGQFYPNRVGFSNTTLDGLIDQQSQETDPATRLALLSEIQHSVYYDVAYLWLYQAKSNDIFRDWVTGYYSNPMTTAGTGNYYYDLNK
jgi:peptide/nickel transport system substrate-binding protein